MYHQNFYNHHANKFKILDMFWTNGPLIPGLFELFLMGYSPWMLIPVAIGITRGSPFWSRKECERGNHMTAKKWTKMAKSGPKSKKRTEIVEKWTKIVKKWTKIATAYIWLHVITSFTLFSGTPSTKIWTRTSPIWSDFLSIFFLSIKPMKNIHLMFVKRFLWKVKMWR